MMPNPKRIEKGMYWDRAWSLVGGCSYVSPGCQNCWSAAETHMRSGQSNEKIRERYQGLTDEWGKWNGQVRLLEQNLELPLRVKKPTVWAVWNDLFHEDVPDMFIIDALSVMAEASQHTFLILTKRSERMKEIMNHPTVANDVWLQTSRGVNAEPSPWPLPNVWLGITAEDQEQADKRIPIMLQTPATKRFVSVEPMLGPVNLTPWIRRYYHGGKPRMKEGAYLLPPSKTGKPTLLQYAKQIDPNCVQRADRVYLTTDYMSARIFAMGYPNGEVYRAIPGLPLEDDPDCTEKGLSFQTPQARITSMSAPILDWVIAGGESGPGARPCHPDWIRSVRDQCQETGTPFFFKQWGEFCYPDQMPRDTYQEVDAAHNLAGHGDYDKPWRVGKKKAGRLLDGRTWDEFPR